ncbi:hypothetical protein E4U31_007031 [Claviceps sp. LM219 group G6]|nr:hypothetical protein E4U31_007031 [Claviceps sp. LM219 group G6]
MSDKQAPSTLQSYVDSATGAIQSAVGSLTGNTAEQVKGDAKQDTAKTEHDASQSAVKVPGATVSSDGGASKDHPERSAGSWNQTVGSAKETVGNVIGSDDLKAAGRQQNAEGQQQEAKGQVKDLGSGVGSRVQGTVGGAVASLTGDKKGEAHYDQMRADGKAQQRGVEHDLEKKAKAEESSRAT